MRCTSFPSTPSNGTKPSLDFLSLMWRTKTNMEGTLYKWTNYLSGWQPRWFILDNGVLSYYKSQEDVNNGCKGSIKMTVCDVVVHSSDSTRLDLVIPAEQHFYLRASTPHERQQWLIALGTSKACLKNGRSAPETGEMSPDIVKTKKSELRLYCDLLMEQVHSVKQSISSTDEMPDVQKLNDATSLLSATCDTFIQTLEDCMKIANATISYEVPPHSTMDLPLLSPTKNNSKMGLQNHIRRSVDRSMKSTSGDLQEMKSILNNSMSDQNLSSKTTNGLDNLTSDSSDCQVSGCEDSSDGSRTSDSQKMSTSSENDSKPNYLKPVSPSPDPVTFVSALPYSFSERTFNENEEVLVEPFLNLCNSILPIFDKLNSTAFAPIKMDFSGNLRKLQAKQSTDTELITLQKVIQSEIKSCQHENSNSATIAILWLKRSLEFIRELLVQVLNGQLDLTIATTEAYNRTLKPFHSWVVRGVFGLAVKAIPSYADFVTQICPANDSGSIRKSEQILYTQMEAYTSALTPIIESLNNFFLLNNLNFDEQV